MAFMASVRTDHREPAHERGRVSGGIQTERGHHRSVAAASTLHQEIAIPFIGHGKRKVDAKLLAANSDPAIDDALDSAICRKRRTVARPPRVRLRGSGATGAALVISTPEP